MKYFLPQNPAIPRTFYIKYPLQLMNYRQSTDTADVRHVNIRHQDKKSGSNRQLVLVTQRRGRCPPRSLLGPPEGRTLVPQHVGLTTLWHDEWAAPHLQALLRAADRQCYGPLPLAKLVQPSFVCHCSLRPPFSLFPSLLSSLNSFNFSVTPSLLPFILLSFHVLYLILLSFYVISFWDSCTFPSSLFPQTFASFIH